MIVKYVTKFQTQFRVVGGCSVSYMVLSLMGGGSPKFDANVEGV